MTSPKKELKIYNNQEYKKIRDECVKDQKRLWEDTSYEATYDSRSDWEWKRPKEIVNKARFVKANIKEEPSRFNLNNLNLGESKTKTIIKQNLAILSVLTLNLGVFRFIVPEDNAEFSDPNYVGLFHFRFWKLGKIYDVVVDDRLPTHEGKLVSYLKDGQPVEFWPFILEKAYMKLFGSAESLSKVLPHEFIIDLTGGVSEVISCMGHTKPLMGDLQNTLFQASERESFIIFGRHWRSSEKLEMKNVYCITKAIYVETNKSDRSGNPDKPQQSDKSKKSEKPEKSEKSENPGKSENPEQSENPDEVDNSEQAEKSEKVLLLRIFMPFMTETKEWTGSWSEESDEWKSASQAQKKGIGVIKKYELLMPFSDFHNHDWDIYIIHLNPQYFENKKISWNLTSVEGKWVRGVSSGGSRRENLSSTFYLNPQYGISLKSPDAGLSDCSLIISLLQKTQSGSRVPMNIYIFELKQKAVDRLDWDFFKHNNPVIDSFPHEDSRELTRRLQIQPGEYCIVVAPNNPHDEAFFILRVITGQKATLITLNDKVAQKDVDVRITYTPLAMDDSHYESDKYVQAFFEEVSGEDRVVGWRGLKKVLDYAMNYEQSKSDNYTVRKSIISYVFPSNSVFDTMENKEFSKSLARSLLATADYDHSGKLDLREFQGLWAQIRQWIRIYELHSDENGFLPKEQLREALDSAGFQLNSDILCSLAIRYSNRDNVIPFDDFVMCASKLRTAFEYYRFKDPEFTDQAVFTIDEWLRKSIYS